MIKVALLLFIFCLSFSISSQTFNFGLNSYSFLNSMYSARSAGLGSNLITVSDNDIGLTVENPSLLNEDHVRSFQLNQALLPSGVHVGMLCYAFKSKFGCFLPYCDFKIMDRLAVLMNWAMPPIIFRQLTIQWG